MVKEYDTLLNAYRRMFGLMDAIHFNSQNTANIFEQYVSVPKGSAVVPITHSGVCDNRKIKKFDSPVLRLGFVGSGTPYKGLPLLKRVISRLNENGLSDRISLNVYGNKSGDDEKLCNVTYKGRFGASQMKAVYDSMDLLVVPSIWNETFGFTVIEAFQYGVPALISNKVGAKDIVKRLAPNYIYETEEDLYQILKQLIDNRISLIDYNMAIIDVPWQLSMEHHANKVVETLYADNK